MSANFDVNQIVSILTSIFETLSLVSGVFKEYWALLFDMLPASTVLPFTFASYFAAAWGLFSLGSKFCKWATIICSVIGTIFLIQALMQ